MTPSEYEALDIVEIDEMAAGWDRRHQLMLRVVGTAAWWLVRMQMDPKSAVDFQPLQITRTLPGFHYMPGEAQLDDEPPQYPPPLQGTPPE